MSVLALLDRPLLLDRTARELLLVAGGLTATVVETVQRGHFSGNTTVYLAFSLALALRLFFARALMVGLIIGAMAQVLPGLRYTNEPAAWLFGNLELVGVWIGALLLLCSRDLVDRFDRAPSSTALLPNRWSTIPRLHAAALRWCGYALGGLAASLVMIWCRSWEQPTWIMVVIVAAGLAGLLLILGRAAVLPAIPLLSAAALAALLPSAPTSERCLSLRDCSTYGDSGCLALGWPVDAAEFVLVAAGFAMAAGVIALPYALRALKHSGR